MDAPKITITDRAVAQFQAALADGGPCIRITIDDRFRHELGVDDPRGDDVRVEVQGIPFILDPRSAGRATGVSIDFIDRASGAGFKIDNPNEPSSAVITLEAASWNADVLGASEPVLVDFWAAWCGPCRAIAPMVEEIAQSFRGRARVGKLNIDDHRTIARQYGVQSIPTLIVFRGGQEVERLVGTKPKDQIEATLEKALA
ncbi:MAG: thioredoxin [Deltaproteobacteria bacterium]|nr:thioredoxin [Deltaproteobacteria bacterium]